MHESSYVVRRFLKNFSRPLRKLVYFYLDFQEGPITRLEQLQPAISKAIEQYNQDQAAEESYSPESSRLAIKAYKDGNWKPIDEVIRELEGSCA